MACNRQLATMTLTFIKKNSTDSAAMMMTTLTSPPLPSDPSLSKGLPSVDLSEEMKVTPTPPITSDSFLSVAQPLLDSLRDTVASMHSQTAQPSACHPKFSLKDYVAEAMGRYKDKLVALSTAANLNLPTLVAVARKNCQRELTELLGKTMELANAYKNLLTGRERVLEKYVAYLKDTDLATLRAKAVILYSKNLDKLLSDMSCFKNAYINDYKSAIKALKHFEEEVIAYLQNPNLLETLVEDVHKAKLIPEKVRNVFASLDCNVSPSLKCRYLILHVNKMIASNLYSFDLWLSLLYRHEGIYNLLDKAKVYCDQSLRASPTVQVNMEHISEKILVTHYFWREIACFFDLPHDLIISIQSTNKNKVDCLRLILDAWIMQKCDCAKPPTLENLESALSRLSLVLPWKYEYIQKSLIELRTMSSVHTNKDILRILDQSQNIKIHENNRVLLGVIVVSDSEASITYQWYKDGEQLNHCLGSQDHIISIFAGSLLWESSYTCRIQQGDHVITSEPIELTIETPLDKYTETLKDIYSAKSEIPEDTWPPVSIDTYINLALIKQQSIDDAGEYARCTIRGDADDVFKDKESIEYENVFDRLGSGARLLIEGRPGSGKTTLVHKVSKDWAKGELRFDQVRLLFLVHLRGFLSDPNIKLCNILECYYDSDPAVDDITKYVHKHNGLGLCFILDGLDEYLPKKKDTFIHRLINKSQLPRALVIVASRPAAVADFRSIASRQIEVLGFLKEQISEYIKEYNFSDTSKCSELLKYLDHHPNVHHMCYLPIHTAMVCYLCQVDRSLPETETGIYKEFTIYFFLRALRQLNDDEDIYIDSIESLPSSERETYVKICKLAFEMTISSKQVMRQKDVQTFFNVRSNRDYFGLLTFDRVALKYGFQKLYTFLHLTFQEFLTAYHISKLEEEEQTELFNEYGNSKLMQNVWKFYCGLVKFDDCDKFKSLVNETQTGTLYKVQCSFESQQPNTCDSIVEDGSLSFKDKFLTPSDFTAMAFVISHATQGTLNRLVFDGCTLGPEGIEVLVKKAGEKLSLVTSLCFHGHNCAPEQLKIVNKLIHVLPSLEILDITNTQLGEEAVSALTGGTKLHPNLQFLKTDTKLYSSSDLTCKLIHGFRSQCSKAINVWFPDHSKKCLSSLLSLPFYFCSTGNLSDVNMSFCNLRLVEVKIFSDDLKMNSVCNRLSLINCGITDEGVKVLSGGIGCSNIKILELSLNHIGDEGALALVHSIESCLSLHTLNLSCNCVGDDGAMAIVKAIVSKHDKNFSLHLWNNNITKHGANALLQIMANININSLDIDSRNIGSSGAAAVSLSLTKYKNEGQALTDALNGFGNLLKLNLSCNSIGDDGTKTLADALKNCSNLILTSLNLSSNSIDSVGAKSLADVLKHCPALGTLDISNNNIRVAGVKALAGSLKYCKDLHTLNIACNSLHCNDAVALADLIKRCPTLCKLIIADNSIGVHGSHVLAGAIKCCKNLHILDISCNNIGAEGAKALAGTIRQCVKLQTLDVAHNHIGENGTRALVHALKNCADLRTLKFSYSNIDVENAKTFATTVRCCNKLSTLHLDHCGLNYSDVQSLADALKDCKNMHHLDISFNSISIDGAKTLASALKNYHDLHSLDICSNNIGDSGAHALASALKKCYNLHTLDVGSNGIGNDGAQALADGIKNCSNLHTLDISHNEIGSDGAIAFSDAIKHCCNLHTLELSHNNIGHDGIKTITGAIGHLHLLGICHIGFPKFRSHPALYLDVLQALSVAISHNRNLYKLDIAQNDIGGSGMKVLADAISHCSRLHTLMLGHNKIGPKGSEALADAIKCCSNLHTLDVGYSNIDDSGMIVLADAISHCSRLHTLILGHNNIGPEGSEALAEAIKCCSNLHTLDVGYSNIDDSGMIVLADALEHCSCLHTLIVSGNKIRKDGIQALAGPIKCHRKLHLLDISSIVSNRRRRRFDDEVIPLADVIMYCSNLHTLIINNNHLTRSDLNAVSKALKKCSNLHVLDISHNDIGDNGAQGLTGIMKCCRKLQSFDISHIKIGKKGAGAIADSLKYCHNLKTLKFDGIGSSDEEVLKIALQQHNVSCS